MSEIDGQLREIRSELRRLQRKVAQLTMVVHTQTNTLLSMDEASLLTGYAKSYLYKLTETGEIPCYRPTKRRVFVEREELERWIRKSKK